MPINLMTSTMHFFLFSCFFGTLKKKRYLASQSKKKERKKNKNRAQKGQKKRRWLYHWDLDFSSVICSFDKCNSQKISSNWWAICAFVKDWNIVTTYICDLFRSWSTGNDGEWGNPWAIQLVWDGERETEREGTMMCYVQFGCRAQKDMTSLVLIAGNAE